MSTKHATRCLGFICTCPKAEETTTSSYRKLEIVPMHKLALSTHFRTTALHTAIIEPVGEEEYNLVALTGPWGDDSSTRDARTLVLAAEAIDLITSLEDDEIAAVASPLWERIKALKAKVSGIQKIQPAWGIL